MLLYGGIIGYYEHAEPSLIFHPEKPGPPEITAGAQAVHLTAADGVPLFGWIIKADPAKYPYWILYFHGNEGTVASPTDWYRIFHELGMSVFTIDYRGYGQSEGTPSEAGLYPDFIWTPRPATTTWSKR